MSGMFSGDIWRTKKPDLDTNESARSVSVTTEKTVTSLAKATAGKELRTSGSSHGLKATLNKTKADNKEVVGRCGALTVYP